eukprot:m.1638983 g.1638983  ORF g.1638983 m.1638983 type:complete len:419 (+) comp32284_c0_seq1:299-1555(+)
MGNCLCPTHEHQPAPVVPKQDSGTPLLEGGDVGKTAHSGNQSNALPPAKQITEFQAVASTCAQNHQGANSLNSQADLHVTPVQDTNDVIAKKEISTRAHNDHEATSLKNQADRHVTPIKGKTNVTKESFKKKAIVSTEIDNIFDKTFLTGVELSADGYPTEFSQDARLMRGWVQISDGRVFNCAALQYANSVPQVKLGGKLARRDFPNVASIGDKRSYGRSELGRLTHEQLPAHLGCELPFDMQTTLFLTRVMKVVFLAAHTVFSERHTQVTTSQPVSEEDNYNMFKNWETMYELDDDQIYTLVDRLSASVKQSIKLLPLAAEERKRIRRAYQDKDQLPSVKELAIIAYELFVQCAIAWPRFDVAWSAIGGILRFHPDSHERFIDGACGEPGRGAIIFPAVVTPQLQVVERAIITVPM